MSVPEAPNTAFDTLMIEPDSLHTRSGTSDQVSAPESLSVIRTDPETGVRTETTLASVAAAASATRPTAPNQVLVGVRKRFTELDGLRGAAALLVVVFHLRRYIDDLNPPRHLDQLLSGGYLMVDLFFVISGFVLARSMLATRTAGDVFRFSSMRARRFLPLHLTGVAIVFGCVLVTWLTQYVGYQGAPDRPAFSIEQESPWGYLSAVLLLQGLIGPHFAGYAAAWSLSIELWTNILLVVAIAAVPWARRKQLVGPVAVVLGSVILFTLAKEGENSIGWIAFGRGLTGLGLGMVVYWAYTAGVRRGLGRPATGAHLLAGRPEPDGNPGTANLVRTVSDRQVGGYRPARWPAVGAVLGLLGLITCMYVARDIRDLRFLPLLLVAAGLIFCLVQPSDGPAHRLLNSAVVQWLGSRSFALYALHGAVLTTIKLGCRLAGLHMHDPKVAAFIIVTGLTGALIAAEIGHRFIERLWVPKNTG
jgi:peptidoglycan/LPS O-acetylase OafA/YrhL